MNAYISPYKDAPHGGKPVQEIADAMPDIPALAYRFEDSGSYIVPSTCRLALYLSPLGARGRPVRVLEHTALTPNTRVAWHSVETYFVETDRWIEQHVCVKEGEAFEEARTLCNGFDDPKPASEEQQSH